MSELPRVYSYFDPPGHPGYDFHEGIGADQSFVEECDINTIMARIVESGDPSPLLVDGKVFGDVDVTELPADFMQAQMLIAEANQAFDQLPLRIRQRFNFQPSALVDFLGDAGNLDEAVRLGLAVRPSDVPATPPAAASSAAASGGDGSKPA